MEFTHEAIFCIVNDGYSEAVMESAKKLGATGGTVIKARGTASKEAETFFHITIEPEKEIALLVVNKQITNTPTKVAHNITLFLVLLLMLLTPF